MIKIKAKYIDYLEKHRNDVISYDALYIKPYQILRDNNRDDELRTKGVFFSGSDIADKLIALLGDINPLDNVIDPCCGIGDLLLAYVKRLPQGPDPQKTVLNWANIVYGNDINKDFVDVAKLRLVMSAFYLCDKRYTIGNCLDVWKDSCFHNLTSLNALDMDINMFKTILLNPPFQQEVVKKEYTWSSGRVSMAAVFLYELFHKNKLARFAAILPDVIRSGTRYQKFRTSLPAFDWKSAEIYGRFDKQTDVDVFLITNLQENNVILKRKKSHNTISKYFEVHVGSIVPHRDPVAGEEHYYLTAKNTPRGAELRKFDKKIKSLKQTFKGPFLVIKRTSSPCDAIRCATTLINSKSVFFVENHLIILLPRDKSLETCRKALDYLSSNVCNKFINKTIRCRHLTVSSINNIPYKQENNNG